MEDIISQAKAEFVRARDRAVQALATTPDDRIDWSPSPTARTPIQQIAHVAMAVKDFHGVLAGGEFPFKTIAEADSLLREGEKQFTTRAQVLDLLDRNSAAYLGWLDTLTPAQLASTVQTPFFALPMPAAIGLLADHLRGHTAQIAYIQTIYGDHNWYV